MIDYGPLYTFAKANKVSYNELCVAVRAAVKEPEDLATFLKTQSPPPVSAAPTADELDARRLVKTLVNATCRQQDEPSEDNQNEYRAARDAVLAALTEQRKS